jgi:fructoselysine 6-kinase
MNTIAVSLGDGCIDHYISPIEKDFIGGNALNVAVHMQRAGLPCAFVGHLGKDQHGERILQTLHKEGINVSRVQITTGPTKRVNIRLTGDNEPIFIHEQHGATTQILLDDETLAFIQQHRLVHTGWRGGAQAYLSAIAGTPLQVSIDYGEGRNTAFIEETLSLADVAFFSMPEGTEEQARRRAQEMCRGRLRLVVVTRGRQGSLAYLSGELYRQPAYPVSVVDTLGAGDAFIGTFLAGWLIGLSAADCLERASHAAAFTCTHHGGWYGAEAS